MLDTRPTWPPSRSSTRPHRAARAFAVLALLITAAGIVAVISSCSSTSPGTATTTSQTSATSGATTSSAGSATTTTNSPAPTTTVTVAAQLKPLERAYNSLTNLSRYAFSLDTWLIGGQDQAEKALTGTGAKVDPWVYLDLVTAGSDPVDFEVALRGQTSFARIHGGDWGSAEQVFANSAALRAAPLENPVPVAELVPVMLAKATRISPEDVHIPAYAPTAPAGSTVYGWISQLLTGSKVEGSISNTVWLDEQNRVVRVDRETNPAVGSTVKHAYTVITYSRWADGTLSVPVPSTSQMDDNSTAPTG